MFDPNAYFRETANALADMVATITDEHVHLTPSEWAETTRYLPRQNSPQPGPFSFDATPYWREVIDCVDPDSPVHFVAIQKGAQVGATVCLIENIIGYEIDYVRTNPVIFATADVDLAQLRIETNVVPMLQHSGLNHLIQSNDEGNNRKQGRTNKKIEWAGGGYLLPFGAQSANKMRSFSVPVMLRDEVSGWPLTVGRDADPMKLTETRTNSFESTRKVVDLSTPNVSATDVISRRFKLGDQRYYEVPCKHCGKFQVLKFRGVNEDGTAYGLVWKLTEDGRVEPGSTRYVCRHCSGEMINEDKAVIMPRGKWVPTAKPSRPDFRSYHVSALYAPHFARTWEAIAMAWVEAWDDEANLPIDMEELQVFYNNDLGEPFEQMTEKVKQHQVSPHRRAEYRLGELPWQHAQENAGGNLGMLTMAVDVQKTYLSVKVMAWAPSFGHDGYAGYCIDYFRIEGECESVDAEPWEELADIIDNREYLTNDRVYRIGFTMVDASYLPETAYSFCSQWAAGVFPLRGRDTPIKGARIKEFDIGENSTGTRYATVTVDLYKDRWAAALKRQWNKVDKMPRNNWSCPLDLPDKALKELTVEYKREKRDPSSNKLLKTEWFRPPGSRNEMWDLLVYNTAALEMAAYDICVNQLGLEALVWSVFWEEAEKGIYFTSKSGLIQ